LVDPLFFLLLGHYLGDFAFQTDRMAAEKGHANGPLTIHVAIYALTVAACLALGLYLVGAGDQFLTPITVGVFVFIYVEHWIQDRYKAVHFNGAKQALFLDQAIHIIILFAVRLLIYDVG